MRTDLYGTVHKALRSKLFDLSVELARCDPATPAEVRLVVSAYRRTMGFLRDHNQHEEAVSQPLLAARAPEIVASAHSQHEALDRALDDLDATVTELERAQGDERPGIVRRLISLYDDFLAAYLAHMRHEETVVQQAFWLHCSDDELHALRARIQASMSPARFGEWLEIMLPAMNLNERAGMLSGMKSGAPEPAFHAACAIAARVLGQSGWAAIRARTELD